LEGSPSKYCEILPRKKRTLQKRAGGTAQGVGLEFKPQYHQKKEKNQVVLAEGYTDKLKDQKTQR
jgi:hypothetical protein